MLMLPMILTIVPLLESCRIYMFSTNTSIHHKGTLDSWIKSWMKCVHQTWGNTTEYRRKRDMRRDAFHRLHRKPPWRLRRLTAISIWVSTGSSGTRNKIPRNRFRFDTDSKLLRIDNHASRSITHDITDVIGEINKDEAYIIRGIGGAVKGYGCTIKWTIEDDEGKVHDVVLPNSVFVRDSTTRILSPQHWAQESRDNFPLRRGTWCATYCDQIVLYWKQQRFKRTIPLHRQGANVATIMTAPGYNRYQAFEAEIGGALQTYPANVISDDEGEDDPVVKPILEPPWTELRPDPLTTDFGEAPQPSDEPPVHVIIDEEDTKYKDASSEFLHWHHKLGHISPSKIREMAKQGRLPKRLATCKIPLCTSCLYGKATKRPWRGKPYAQPVDEQETITDVGQCVSVDQIESFTPGLIAQMKGTPTRDRYRCATVFVDHKSGLGYVHLQRSTGADETIQAKEAFERYALQHGVKVVHYHADNGRFAERKFRDHVDSRNQTISFCGVGAHFQNGVAERRIRELQESARAMLIHAKTRWPEAVNVHLWPYALRTANDVLNETWNLKRKVVPLEEFTQTPVQNHLKHWIPFGSPVYVVDKRVQNSQSYDKWGTKSRVALYLGRSPNHARTVALCLSLQTGLVSPQFHFRSDPTFQTMRKAFRISMPLSFWQEKCHFHKPPNKPPNKSPNESIKPSEGDRKRVAEENSKTKQSRLVAAKNSKTKQARFANQPYVDQRQPQRQPPPLLQRESPTRTTRSGRSVKVPARYLDAYIADVDNDPFRQLGEDPIPTLDVMAASANPDVMYLHQAKKEPDWENFAAAMDKELNDQMGNGNWKIVPRSQVPKRAQIVPAVWALRRKRRIKTNDVYRWKARLNIDGSKQIKGVSFWETYSPVVSWPTVRLLLALVLIMRWHSHQIDFVQAYPQAPAETDMLYMEIPKGFHIPGAAKGKYVMSMVKNVYGCRQAGRVWNRYLTKRLLEVGFERSKVDDCVFYYGETIFVVYVDDCILAGPNQREINQAIQAMKDAQLHLTVDGDLADFLGIHIDRKEDGTIHLTQPHLIESILKDLRIPDEPAYVKDTPAKVKILLKRHQDAQQFDNAFHYRSVIGKLNYLEKSTRPDISYAVHQCARFSNEPRKPHGEAVRWLGRYLAGTRDKGIIFKPNEDSFHCYVDADFAGAWDPDGDPKNDPDTARSRTGYVAMLAGCPISYASKLQSVIALSSSESEFIALSTALRDIIPAMNLLKEMHQRGWKVPGIQPKVHCRVFEDNSGALEMAVKEKFRPRTKHVNAKFHHFRSYVASGDIAVSPIRTAKQPADYMTKSLSASVLREHRYTVQGW